MNPLSRRRGHGGPRIWSNTEAGSCKRTSPVRWELFRRMHGRAVFVFVAAAFLAAPSTARAQASAYVPLDDIAYTYVDALMARGMFHELSALERPFTERALRVGIDSARAREP